ncbi:MAG TPA: hypothetical protein VG056_07560 [Pirellulales bacterium]|jgi:hypothetical protein|nr:hypothetical protein [Pirellulales bacterium]
MALIESWLYKRLAGDADVAKFVQNRISPVYAPEAIAERDPNNWSYPFIVYLRGSTERTYVSGAKAQRDGLPVGKFHVHLWHNDYFALKQLEQTVSLALETAPLAVDGFFIDHCFIENEFDVPEPLHDGIQFPTFGVQFDLEIAAQEPLP